MTSHAFNTAGSNLDINQAPAYSITTMRTIPSECLASSTTPMTDSNVVSPTVFFYSPEEHI